MRSSTFMTGLIIILIGFLLLGTNYGWWSNQVWGQIWRLWPVLLVLLGLRKLITSDALFTFLTILILLFVFSAVTSAHIGKGILMNGGHWSFGKDFAWSYHTSPTPGLSSSSRSNNSDNSTFTSEVSVAGLDGLTIDVGHTYNLTIKADDTDKVKVDLKGPKELLDDVSLAPDANRLVLKDNYTGTNDLFSFLSPSQVTGTLTIPKSVNLEIDPSGAARLKIENHSGLLKVRASGASAVSVVGGQANRLDAELSGASNVNIADAQGTTKGVLSGASHLTLTKANLPQLNVEVSGTSNFEMKSGSVVDLTAKGSGASHIRLPSKPTGKIDQEMSGVSKLDLAS